MANIAQKKKQSPGTALVNFTLEEADICKKQQQQRKFAPHGSMQEQGWLYLFYSIRTLSWWWWTEVLCAFLTQESSATYQTEYPTDSEEYNSSTELGHVNLTAGVIQVSQILVHCLLSVTSHLIWSSQARRLWHGSRERNQIFTVYNSVCLSVCLSHTHTHTHAHILNNNTTAATFVYTQEWLKWNKSAGGCKYF